MVTYPFHPLVGRTVLVVGDHEHDGVHHFLIRQPSGGSYQVPGWMFDPASKSLVLVSVPRLPVGQLVLLRALLDRFVAYPAEQGSPEESAMRKVSRVQIDLFVTVVQPAELNDARRQGAVTLLQALLTEAMAWPPGQPSNRREEEGGGE